MKPLSTCLWFDHQAMEAATFYTSIFNEGKIVSNLKNTAGGRFPEGSILTVNFEIGGRKFVGLNGGPDFKFTPAISFYVDCETEAELDLLWEKLNEGGVTLMGLGAYPFSEKFGWVQDQFGVSWQLNLSKCTQQISPFLMFTGKQHGKAREAIDFYCKKISNSKVENIQLYGKNQGEPEGTVMLASFALNGQTFKAIDSAYPHGFMFNEAISFCIYCKTQEEIDFFWEELSQGGSKSECGWLTDQFGVSWQIIPEAFGEMISDENPEKVKAVMDEVLSMQKPIISELLEAYEK